MTHCDEQMTHVRLALTLLKKPISFQMQNIELNCFDVHSQLSHSEYKMQIETLLKRIYDRYMKILIKSIHFVIEHVILIT